MKEKINDFFEQLKEKKTASQLVIYLGVLGMVLILCSELFGQGDTTAVTTQSTSQSVVAEDATLTTVAISTEESYRANLEESLVSLIEQMDGAGETAVMITLVSGEESIYAQDTTESDTQTTQSHVLLENGEALTETVLTPEVCGVAVLCEGGDNIVVVAKITSLVTALFDISSTRVSVEKLG